MMGYLTTKYSTILRSPYFLRWKERVDARNEIRNIRAFYYDVHNLIPKLVAEHKVRAALREQKKASDRAEKAEKAGFKLPIDAFMQIEQVVEVIKHIEQAWNNAEAYIKKSSHKNIHNDIDLQMKRLDREFEISIKSEMAKAKNEEKSQYRELMNIISEAHEKKSKEQFMTEVRNFLTSNPNILSLYAMRVEIARIKYDQKVIYREEKTIKNKLNQLKDHIKRVDNPKKRDVGAILAQIKRITQSLEQDIKLIAKYIGELFVELYRLLARDFSMLLTLEKNIDILWADKEAWIKAGFMPGEPELEKIRELAKVKQRIEDDAHTVAQVFRIVYKEESEIENHA